MFGRNKNINKRLGTSKEGDYFLTLNRIFQFYDFINKRKLLHLSI